MNLSKLLLIVGTATLCSAALLACVDVSINRLDIEYKTWETTTDIALVETIPGHSSGRRKIYINKIGTEVTVPLGNASRSGGEGWDYPSGTIIVKEVYSVVDPEPGDEPGLLLGMIKEPDSAAARGGWIWVLRVVETGEERLFDNEYCVTCHSDANEVRRSDAVYQIGEANDEGEFRDFVFFPFRPQIR